MPRAGKLNDRPRDHGRRVGAAFGVAWGWVGWSGLVVLAGLAGLIRSWPYVERVGASVALPAVGAALVILGLMLGQQRALLAAAWLVLLVALGRMGGDAFPGWVPVVCGGLVLANLGVIAALAPARPLGRRGVVRVVAAVLQVLAVGAILRFAGGLAQSLVSWSVPAGTIGFSPFELAGLAVGGLALVSSGRLRPGGLHRAALWSIVALVAGRAELVATEASIAIAGLAWVVGALEASHALSYRDALTRLPSRRALDMALDDLGRRYSIAMVDVDHFKKLNDRHGHDVGDQVLRMIASRLGRVGGGGRAYRYGGEEFAVVFPGRGKDRVADRLEALRERVAGAPFRVRTSTDRRRKGAKAKRGRGGGRGLRVTVSVGACEASSRRRDVTEVVEAADKALYRAKRAGRNQVRWAPS